MRFIIIIILITINQPPATFSGHFSWIWAVQRCAPGTWTVRWWGAGRGHSHVSPVQDEAGPGKGGGLPPRSLAYSVSTIPWLLHLFCPHFSSAIVNHMWTFQDHRSPDRLYELLLLNLCPPSPWSSSAPLIQVFCRHPAAANTTGPLFSALTHGGSSHVHTLHHCLPSFRTSPRLLPSINFSQGAFHRPSTVVSQSLACCFWRGLSPGPPNAEPADSPGSEL